jgi:hypothetical protein
VTGVIQKGDAPKFLETVINMPQRGTVILDSRGGYIEDAMAIGHTVRRREFTTEVRRGAVCYSACSLIWLSVGRRRRWYSPHSPPAARPGGALRGGGDWL